LVPGVGARTVAALASVSEVLHGAPARFTDPARFAFAQGGKDRHPYPVRLDVYDETLRVLRSAVDAAKLGQDEKLGALHALDQQARRLESEAQGPSLEALAHSGWSEARELLPTESPLPRPVGAPGWRHPPASRGSSERSVPVKTSVDDSSRHSG
jgi:uncharacterized protein